MWMSSLEPSRRAERSQARWAHGLVDECVLLLVGNEAWKKGADVAVGALAVLPGETVLATGGLTDGAEVRQVRSRSDPLAAARGRSLQVLRSHGCPRGLDSTGLLPSPGDRGHGERAPRGRKPSCRGERARRERPACAGIPRRPGRRGGGFDDQTSPGRGARPAIRGERPRAHRSLDLGRQHQPHR
jgi:hypothetical protein